VTTSEFKQQENEIFARNCALPDGTRVSDVVIFDIRDVVVQEVLEVDIARMVEAEVAKAYSIVRVPCIVEHAGLIFTDYQEASYPGGLTKAMWNALGDRFVEETKSQDRRAIARAVVAYCDGQSIHTFIGETCGCIAPVPRGAHQFYWDTVFIPDTPDQPVAGMTYAEIAADPRFGLAYKVTNLSQSTKAMLKFLEYLQAEEPPALWGYLP
jgi:XTP/dITP diphosphohydrolase